MKLKYLLIAVFLIVLSCKKEPQLNANPTIPQSGSQSITIIQDEFENTPM